MKLLFRIIFALVLAILTAASIRVKGNGAAPTGRGGWRPIDSESP